MQEVFSNSYNIIFCISAVCFFVVTTQKPSRNQKIMQLLISFICVLMIGYNIRIKADTLEELVISQKMIYLGGCFLYYYMFLFCMDYCYITLPKLLQHFLMGLSIVMGAITFSFDKHTLLYRSYWMEIENGICCLKKDYGIVHSIYIFVTMLYCVVLLAVAVWYGVHNLKRRRLQSILLIIVPFCPTIPYIIEKVKDLVYDVVPFGLILGLLLMMYLLYVEKIYDLNDTVKEFVFSSIDAALVVIGEREDYKGGNQIALNIFPELKRAAIGDKLCEVSETLFRMLKGQQHEIKYQNKLYEADVKTIEGHNEAIGTVLWLANVTAQKEHLAFLKEYQTRLQKEVELKTEHIQSIQEKILLGMANMVENRDTSTGGHVKRTSDLVRILVDELLKEGDRQLPLSFCENIVHAAPMHDLGKIAIEDRILKKTGRYTEAEYEIMKLHAAKGADIVHSVLNGIEDEDFVRVAQNIAHYHHERWDGSGYPEHLAKEEIPLEARIMAIADVYDALVSERCYKMPMSFIEAYRIITESMGTQFDPNLNNCFIHCREKIERYYGA